MFTGVTVHVSLYAQEIDLSRSPEIVKKIEEDRVFYGIRFYLLQADNANGVTFWLPDSVVKNRRIKELLAEAAQLIEEVTMTV
jgi:hypothetical protein